MSNDKEAKDVLSNFDLMPDWAKDISSESDNKNIKNKNFDLGTKKTINKRYDRGSRRGVNHNRDNFRGNRGFDKGDFLKDKREREKIESNFRIEVVPIDEAMVSLKDFIKSSFRAYSIIELGRAIMADKNRYRIRLIKKEIPDGVEEQSIVCNKDQNTIFLSEEEAIDFFIKSEDFEKFYKLEKIEVGEPKGNFTTIAICTIGGEVICPPNYHEYQDKISKLHNEKYQSMDFDRFRHSIQAEKDDDKLSEWKKASTYIDQYVYKPDSEEKKILKNRIELVSHIRENLSGDLFLKPKSTSVPGDFIKPSNISANIAQVINFELRKINRFPIALAKGLVKRFTKFGLKVFKMNGREIFIGIAIPRSVPVNSPLADNFKQIVDLVGKKKKVKFTEILEDFNLSLDDNKTEKKSQLLKVLGDYRWLLSSGYLIELSDGHVILGREQKVYKGQKKETAVNVKKAEKNIEEKKSSENKKKDGDNKQLLIVKK